MPFKIVALHNGKLYSVELSQSRERRKRRAVLPGIWSQHDTTGMSGYLFL